MPGSQAAGQVSLQTDRGRCGPRAAGQLGPSLRGPQQCFPPPGLVACGKSPPGMWCCVREACPDCRCLGDHCCRV